MNSNKVYHVARELYRSGKHPETIEMELQQAIEEMKEDPAYLTDIGEYLNRYGLQQFSDWDGNRVTKIDYAGLEKIEVRQYPEPTELGQLGTLTMIGERVRYPAEYWIITKDNRLEALERLLGINFLPPAEKETLVLAFLELAATNIDDLVYLVYGSEVLNPARRRKYFMMVSAYMKENDLLDSDDWEYLQGIEANISPKEEIVHGFVRLRLELPQGFYMTVGSYGRPVDQTKPDDNIIHLEISYWNPHFPRVFDRSINRGYSLNELQDLIKLIREEKQLDGVAEGYFIEFVDRIKRQYKYK